MSGPISNRLHISHTTMHSWFDFKPSFCFSHPMWLPVYTGTQFNSSAVLLMANTTGLFVSLAKELEIQ